MQISVQSGPCPITGKITYALYDGALPVIAATIYLRHLGSEVDLGVNTLAARAHALKLFFEFLHDNGASFWELTPALVKQYKRSHLSRKETDHKFLLKRKTAQQYLSAVKGLVQYWRAQSNNDPLFIDQAAEMDGIRRKRSLPGALHTTWYAPVPSALWRIRIPIEERHDRQRYKGLSREACQKVMTVLNRTAHHTKQETMLFYRDRAIWIFLLMTGLRKGELCRIRCEDVNAVAGTISLNDRAEDARLGNLKTGPGEIFVTARNPYWKYLDSWLLEGRWIAEEMLHAHGLDDHGLLFTNHNGAPLTQAAVDHLFVRLKAACRFGDEMHFHPHITRHTVATLMLDNGVALTEIQRFLRHQSAISTELYAKVAAPSYRAAMERFWQSLEVTP
jgi:site-specific recombinase XerD